MKVLGADDNNKAEEEAKHAQAQQELEMDGAGTRKKIRTIKAKTIIREVEFDNKEWEGFPDEIMTDSVAPAVAKENSSPILHKKRRYNDKIVSPRKPLRQLNAHLEPIGEDSEEKISKRKKKEMRKSGRMSLLVMDTETTTQQHPQEQTSLVNASQSHEVKTLAETRILPPAYMSTARMTSPGKKMRLHMSPSRRSSLGEPRRLSGALFADADPTPLATIDFSTPLKSGSKFRFGADRAVGTPVRTFVAFDAPKTAPAKVQPTRTELELEMANFFTPIPRDKKSKRRSSPIKSYLQVLLENKSGTGFDSPSRDADSTDTEENETRDEVVQDMELDAPQTSSPTPSPNRDAVSPAEAAVGALPGRFNLGMVPDLKPASSPTLARRYAEYGESHDESIHLDDVPQKQNIDISFDSASEISEADAADQLRAEFAAVVNTSETALQCEQAIESDTESEHDDQHDELMIDADAVASESAAVSSPLPIASLAIDTINPIADESIDSNQSVDTNPAAPVNYEDEEAEMLRAFITKSKLAKTAKAASPKKNGSPKSPKRLPLAEVVNASPPSSPSARTRKKGTPSTPIKKGVLKIVATPEPTTSPEPAAEKEETSKAEPTNVRRSGRTPKKSGILPPGSIAVRHLGAEAPKREKTLEQQTKLNTSKNKAGCIQPEVMLKRLRSKEARQAQLKELFDLSQKEKVEGKKEVIWAEKLVMVREFDMKDAIFEDELRAKEKEEKEKAKTKNVRVGTAASKLALGMSGNGTPAKRKMREPAVKASVKEAASAEVTVAEGETTAAAPAAAITPKSKGKQQRLRSPKVKVTIAKAKGKK